MAAQVTTEPRTHDEYTVGWVCPLPKEQTAAMAMLDRIHPDLSKPPTDNNVYTLGSIGKHNVVIAGLPKGNIGNISAAIVTTQMVHAFPSIKFCLMVGIGGGIPPNVRLGDVVVSTPTDQYPGVVQWDFGKAQEGGKFKRIGALDSPPKALLAALAKLEAEHTMRESKIPKYLDDLERNWPKLVPEYTRSDSLKDVLFAADYPHRNRSRLLVDFSRVLGMILAFLTYFLGWWAFASRSRGAGQPENVTEDTVLDGKQETSVEANEDLDNCRFCDTSRIINREPRDMRIHYGLIASGEKVIKDATERDRLNEDLGGHALCVDMEAAGLLKSFPGIVIRGICDYADSHKNKKWQEHAAAVAAAFAKEFLSVVPIQDVEQMSAISRIEKAVNKLCHRQIDQKHQAILTWFSKIPSQKKQAQFQTNRQGGEYLLKSQEFDSWLNGKERVLWCIGPPGAGKTILSSIVIDTINNSLNSSKVGIAFLYCVYAERNDQNIEQLLGSLIQQLLFDHIIPHDILELYDSYTRSGSRPDPTVLSKHLSSVVSIFSKVYIVVDALDECDDETRRSLVTKLQGLNADVRLFFTSRPLGNFEILDDATQFKVYAQKEDIRNYIIAKIRQQHFLNELCTKFTDLKKEILDKIIAKADGIFLLAELHFQSIKELVLRKDVRRALANLPETLNDRYRISVERIQGGPHKQLAMNILLLLSYTLRPLNFDEIQHALLTMALDQGETSIDPDDIYPKELLLTICAGIIILEEKTSIVRFVHHTAEMYFESNRKRLFEDGHLKLTEICITYLSFDDFKSGFCDTEKEFKERLQFNQLYNYAARNWGHHAREASIFSPRVIEFLEDPPIVEASSQALIAIGISSAPEWGPWSQQFLKNMTGLHLAAYFGVQKAVDILLQHWQNIDIRDSLGLTPLMYAAKEGHEAIVKLLLATDKVDINAKDYSKRTPLSFAIKEGHKAIVELLLATEKVDVDVKDRLGQRRPLSYAAEEGHEAIVKLLLATEKVNIDAKDYSKWTPLLFAAKEGHKVIVELLLATEKVDVDAKDNSMSTPLIYAAKKGHEAIVKLLLATEKVDIDAKNDFFDQMTPLIYAAEKGHEVIVKLLLATGKVDIDAKNYRRSTPLLFAAKKGHKAIVELLLATKEVNVNAKDIMERTPLLYAAEQGHEAIVKLLLATEKVDVDTKDGVARTPLLYAAAGGHEAIVKLLLATEKVDVDTKDGVARTPLLYAAEQGHEAIVKLLLATEKVDVDTKDDVARTPLSYAAEKGHKAIVELLLATKKVNVNAKDSMERTPLLYAAAGGHKAIVKLLQA